MSSVACVMIDWGTTSFRLWSVDKAGMVVASRQGGFGMSTLKPAEFHGVMEENLEAIGIGPDVPVVICGMAGAAQGWIEAPYVETPADLSSVAQHAVRVPGISRDVRILPGLAQHVESSPDVMRGEETLLLGTGQNQNLVGSFCLPGTHSKWAWLEAGIVKRFSTAMTGELFGLLARQSTLAPYIKSNQGAQEGSSAFDQAVIQATKTPECALQLLFSIRAIPLLKGKTWVSDMASRLSGLLIGLEIAGMCKPGDPQLTLISSGHLGQNYARAFDVAGIRYSTLDAELAARSGLLQAARTIWPGILEETA